MSGRTAHGGHYRDVCIDRLLGLGLGLLTILSGCVDVDTESPLLVFSGEVLDPASDEAEFALAASPTFETEISYIDGATVAVLAGVATVSALQRVSLGEDPVGVCGAVGVVFRNDDGDVELSIPGRVSWEVEVREVSLGMSVGLIPLADIASSTLPEAPSGWTVAGVRVTAETETSVLVESWMVRDDCDLVGNCHETAFTPLASLAARPYSEFDGDEGWNCD
ncbi:MAG: hypothetical protein JKY37_03960 [Nannocystaceae bacterium]|nr:hypothetical protein [Nannocystaceae bacterium]